MQPSQTVGGYQY